MRRQALTKRIGLVAATTATGLLMGFTGMAQATPAEATPTVIAVEEAAPGDATAAPVQTYGTSCTMPLCGRAHNRTGKDLQIERDAKSHWNCDNLSGDHRRTLKSGDDSNNYWKDTDCVRSVKCKIIFRGESYKPGEWIRLYNPTWFYNVNC
ncbi:hypothetical protein [Amycolatopsis sp. lyj-84]|uniref:hypothetical protein n=1 Tax=Amycolatopsis sp. lyj-84 TaxID=2789284 RepID=UPI003979E1B6